ncbi:AsnC family protein [Methanosarcinales archaeon ex4572_44]|nr:MAG: AsnC family protein [Methanosarcinales archaeon ex4572_44]HHI30706.1 Lrp/AsnC family transcriptional regulator [Candidatus Methanoperedenaceae archaeon]
MKDKTVPLDELDKELLNLIQLDFPLEKEPFKELGKKLKTTENEVIDRVKRLMRKGAVRRIGPVINRENSGGAGVLAALRVEEERIDEVAEIINEYDQVSHNYQREGPYNIWFTVSAENLRKLDRILDEIESRTGCTPLRLPTEKVFKIGVRFEIR